MSELVYVVIRVVNGQEIYAKIDLDDANSKEPFLVMEDPLVQEEYFNEDGTTSVSMTKYSMATHDKIVPLAKHAIISTSTQSDAFKESIGISTLSLAKYDQKLTDMATKMAAHNIVFQDDADGHTYQSTSKH